MPISDMPRTVRFKFANTNTYEIPTEILESLLQKIKLSDIVALQNLMPDGPRDHSNDVAYKKLEQLFFPLLNVEIFWDNFSEPGLIFTYHKTISQNLTKIKPPVETVRISYIALWDGDADDSKSLELNIEASVLLDVVDGIDISAYTDWSSDVEKDANIEDQLRECGNMFNFFFKDIDLEDDGVFENDWDVEELSVKSPR